ncbi:MAG: autotransporter-associated beta strand repeat-containing protein [Lentisphaeria bacterium]|jgi:autotransporter-associated beta strand protein
MKTSHAILTIGAAGAAAAALIAPAAFAADVIWDGDTSTDWANSANWNGGTVPTNGDVAEFITSYTNNPTLTASTNNVGLWSTGALPQSTIISLGGNTLNLAGTTTINGNANTAILLDNTGGRSLNITGAGTIAVLDNTSFLVNNNTAQLGIGSTLSIADGKTLTLGGSAINTTVSILFNTAIAASTGAVYIDMSNSTGKVNFGNSSHLYTGGTTVHSGILTLGTANPYGVIRGALTIDAAGKVIASANSWSLGQMNDGSAVSSITIKGGELNFIDNANGGTVASSITMTGGTISGSGYDWYNAITSTPTFTTNASSTTATVSSGMQLRLGSGRVTFDVASGTAPDGVDLLVSGAIKNYSGGNTGGITKTGAGTMVLSGENTYQGSTIVSAGTLAISAGNINSTSGITINGGELKYNSATALSKAITFTSGKLSGTGTIGTALTVGAGATLSPGNSIGTQAYTSGLTISGGTLDIELGRDGTTPVSDLADVTGAVTLSTDPNLKLTLYSGLNNPVAGDIFYLISNDGTDAISGVFTKLDGTATTLSEGSEFAWNSQQWKITYLADYNTGFTGGNDLAITVVPEPAALALLLVGGVGLLRRRRTV